MPGASDSTAPAPVPPAWGHRPVPVHPLGAMDAFPSRIFVKREDLCAQPYGGNKVRKLEHLVAQARRTGTLGWVTVGGIGSHFVLASAWYGRAHGMRTWAVFVPQVGGEHARQTARASVGLLSGWKATRRFHQVPGAMLRLRQQASQLLGHAPLLVPAGGSSLVGAHGSLALGREIAADIAAAHLPVPDRVFLPLGSGGTAAGVLVGLRLAGLSTRVVAVRVVSQVVANGPAVRTLAGRLNRQQDPPLRGRLRGLVVDHGQMGPAYGQPTRASLAAAAWAQAHGLQIDPTYSAKALAACLADARHGPPGRTLLFVATAHSGPLAPVMGTAPATLPPELAALMAPVEPPPG